MEEPNKPTSERRLYILIGVLGVLAAGMWVLVVALLWVYLRGLGY